MNRNSKFISHRRQFNCLVAFQELRVNDDSDLANEVSDVLVDIRIQLYKFNDLNKHLEELTVSAIVK
jgi:hypothetical protein